MVARRQHHSLTVMIYHLCKSRLNSRTQSLHTPRDLPLYPPPLQHHPPARSAMERGGGGGFLLFFAAAGSFLISPCLSKLPSSSLQQTVHQSQTSLHFLPINNQCSIYLRVVRRDVYHTSQSPDLKLNYDLFGVTFKTTLPITTIKHQLRVEYFSVLQYSSRDLTNIYQFAVKLLW